MLTPTETEERPWLDVLFARIYERNRRRYVETFLFVSGCGIVLLAWPAQFLTLLPLWGFGDDDWQTFGLTMLCGILITEFLMPWAAFGPFRPIVLMLRGHQVPPEEVWYAAVRRMPWVSVTSTASYCVFGNIPLVLFVGASRDFTLLDYVSGWLVASIITAAAGFFFVLIWEVAFRPVLREVQPQLPADFDPGVAWMTLSRRSALASASAMAYTGAAVSCLVSATTDREWALAIAVLGTAGSAASFGGVITGLVSHSIFMRVSELKAALVRIGDRERGVRVAVRAGDELDEAAMSLNRMAERLETDDDALRASRARLASIADGERQRMERDLRRRVLERLESVGAAVAVLEEELAERDDLSRLCVRVRGSVAEAESEIRRLARGVYPEELTESGLEAALAATAERMALPTVLDLPGVGRVSEAVESAVYFCCKEALQNAAKHAGPGASTRVTLGRGGGVLVFEVADNGTGLAGAERGRGLENMRDRIRAVGGDLEITSKPGAGTAVAGWVPA